MLNWLHRSLHLIFGFASRQIVKIATYCIVLSTIDMVRHRRNRKTPQPQPSATAPPNSEPVCASFTSLSLQGQDESKGDKEHPESVWLLEGRMKAPVEKARNVYLPTACQFCKRVAAASLQEDTETPLLPVPEGSSGVKHVESGALHMCAGCRMVKYCSKQHQVSDWGSHKSLCKLVGQYLKVHRQRHLYEDVSEKNLSQTEWLQVRYHFIEIFHDYLGRELHPFEKEILLFPNVCAICRKAAAPQDAEVVLVTCPKCNGVTFCSKHIRKDHDHCQELRVWTKVVCWEHEHGLMAPDLSTELGSALTLSDFPSSIHEYHSRHYYRNGSQADEDDIPFVRRTDVLTVPFSIAWMLSQLLRTQNSQRQSQRQQDSHSQMGRRTWTLDAITALTIHLIGAEREFEGSCPAKWEALSHLFPYLQQLHVVLIGPELGGFDTKQTENLRLCANCVRKKRQIRIEFETALYHEYCQSRKFVEPNIVCAFNCGMYRTTGFVDPGEDSWKPTLQNLMTTRSPLPSFIMVTEYTQAEILQDSLRIQRDCPHLHEKTELSGRNPFRSLRPQRALINEDTEPLMFKNNFVTLFVTEKE